MRCDPKRIWYHGDQHRRITFSDQRFQNRDNPNAMGPGIYFTSSKKQAIGYARPNGWVYTARVSDRCATDDQRMTTTELRRFLALLDEEGRA